jgi:hypothetical protein
MVSVGSAPGLAARVRTFVIAALMLSSVLGLPHTAIAQQASGIAGLVKDTSGAVLPGVTVEAASPVLIEKVRSVVTDADGRYSIVDLRPGSYSVTFTLPGFRTLKRDGIDLGAGFTATVNGDLEVGSLEETITVSGAAPLVDTQNARQQTVVPKDLLETLPTSQMSMGTLANLTPGMNGNPDVGGSAGTYSQQAQVAGFHGKTNSNRINYDGMRVSNMCGVSSISYIINGAMVEEMVVETGGFTAESNSSSVLMNAIPKEGGNLFRGGIYGTYSNGALQSQNLNQDLRSRGITQGFESTLMYHFDATVGGPIAKDRLWFFTAHRWTGNRNKSDVYWNATQGTPFYTEDRSRPGTQQEDLRSNAVRLTWQLSPKNKINAFVDLQDNKMPRHRRTTGFVAPEALPGWSFPEPAGLYQATWTSPVTSKLLLEAGASFMLQPWCLSAQEGVTPEHISITEASTGLTYNSATGVGPYGTDPCRKTDRYAQRFSVSYVTGSHNFKVGVQNEQGIHDSNESTINPAFPVSYRFQNAAPVQLTMYASPYEQLNRLKADLGIFAQDTWRFQRLSLSMGLRFDYLNAGVKAQQAAASPFLPARRFEALAKVPEWFDLSPRLGASYDLFGNGRTALKLSAGKYMVASNGEIAKALNPFVTSVNSVNRAWTDRDGDYFPDCDLNNPVANGECGVFSNSAFGQQRVTTRYSDQIARGFSNRDYLWDVAAEVQHQLSQRVSATFGYYRNWYGNFSVTDNLAVTPEDFDPYCITAPTDARLPGGGGYQVCGLYDIKPAQFGQVDNLVRPAGDFGKQQRQSDFFQINFSTRFENGIRLGGGVDTGRTITDTCFTVDSPQQVNLNDALSYHCRQVIPFAGNTQVKLNGSVPLPLDFVVSAIYQSTSGPAITAIYSATNAEVVPSLGRSLSGGTRTVNVSLIEPFKQFEKRRNQLDFRLSKVFRTQSYRIRANLDLYNALNAASILGINNNFGAQWRRPQSGGGTNSAVLDARLIQISADITF